MMLVSSFRVATDKWEVEVMSVLRVGAHTALDATAHLAVPGFAAFVVLATAPHCWPAELNVGAWRTVQNRLDANGLATASFMRPETMDMSHRVIDLPQAGGFRTRS